MQSLSKKDICIKCYGADIVNVIPIDYLWEIVPNNVRKKFGFPLRRKPKGARKKVVKYNTYLKYRQDIFLSICEIVEKNITIAQKEIFASMEDMLYGY
jgi:hypothetical protein